VASEAKAHKGERKERKQNAQLRRGNRKGEITGFKCEKAAGF